MVVGRTVATVRTETVRPTGPAVADVGPRVGRVTRRTGTTRHRVAPSGDGSTLRDGRVRQGRW